ncbi:hypothetical protein A2631_02125 [Candidatus Daviesbacteria bacterium RIFCSPHIGHO2_01_FULL_44_29]|uniref:Serine hydroxymethyltransferase-like domain-containing protein n=1 Tax=Candidatus Daviesbacteria bacterium RIFCSPHIGHO2_02_FULL_43_12 TaxID=1797776 RepID=A0A1F5KJZ0_9BACT|nr:MAG: hypothetical protein A2631_02125 [Candidatus Daviesbacteria bacterium RIFCSPHIGHO2_01_FULL_44_29]OGE39530.1 MAG: hypothetical protein A3E86_01775 [Candidatus Daviesbacteria bacterium RIFCSPHIGHO2_12_FULL_47_45]OGE41194.1 MAG: hypothetical protein A3D25_01520 [Candidatus Daviesbacteria bacterium RIFCSPHIGHO2_02_FULL_43_12]OGE69393.1 MAG: hypothetical protein A3B55_03260 [Candidatus Daviesbacteria bacterium RIFCSPLOWO2_01_FULL_43_15]
MNAILGKLRTALLKTAKLQDQLESTTINLIAADNATPFKYLHKLPYKRYAITEGLLGKRPYAGVKYFDQIEQIAVDAAKYIFKADHANVQPHSGSQANQSAYLGLLANGDRVLAMSFSAGGHLTHGLKINFSGRFFDFSFYGVDADSGLIDYKEIEKKAIEIHPKMIVCGASSYPRNIDYEKLSLIARKVGAYLMADISHPVGLIATRVNPSPFPFVDVATLTLDKTLRGPHGGIVLCKQELREKIDKGVHPGTQSSIPLQRIVQIALCLIDAGSKEYELYTKQVIKNIKIFEKNFNQFSKSLVISGGTDTHMIIIDTYNVFGLTGKEAEFLLEEVGILTNRQVVPKETLKPYVGSGVRLGTAWSTSRGYLEQDFEILSNVILDTLKNPTDKKALSLNKKLVSTLVKKKRKNDTWA